MIESIENVVNAIESLQSNPYKDYILPVGSVLVSASVGIFAAHYSVHKQESNRINIANVEAVNDLLLQTASARDNLISIKSNYYKVLDGHPINRLLVIPPIFFDDSKAHVDVSKLSFLHSDKLSRDVNKWLNVVRINSIFKNYNFLLNMWTKRNELIEEFVFPIVSRKHGNAIKHQDFIDELGLGKVAEISDVTEQAISLTDDLLIELCCFLEAFSVLSKRKLDPKVLKKYCSTLNFKLPSVEHSQYAVDMMSLVEELNLTLLTKVLHVPKAEAQERYKKVYLV